MERGRALPRDVAAGDILIGVASSGVHSNGYSLVRALVARAGLDWGDPCPFGPGQLGPALLTPTAIYIRPALAALATGGVRALAHITGGGITGNLPRVLPGGLGAAVDLAAWSLPPVFRWLRDQGGLGEGEMLRTFNCGIGMIAVAAPDAAAAIAAAFAAAGHATFTLGQVVPGDGVITSGRLA
jgi:phosphoribosylformylglycinamidine cyclo-ligase